MREYLVEMRKRCGMSQKAVADALQISTSTYSLIENDLRRQDMSIGLVNKLAGAFGINPSQVFDMEQAHRQRRKTAS